jgi:RNA polymerase sigma-B factor
MARPFNQLLINKACKPNNKPPEKGHGVEMTATAHHTPYHHHHQQHQPSASLGSHQGFSSPSDTTDDRADAKANPPATGDTATLSESVLEAHIGLMCQKALSPRQVDRLKRDLIRFYQPYVASIARGLARRKTDPLEDLIQVGCMGLLRALAKYNPAMNVRFKTYCTYYITGEIRHYLRDKVNLIKAPRALSDLYYRMNQVIAELTQQLERHPTDLEIATALQCPTEQLAQVQEVERRQQTISLDTFHVVAADRHYPALCLETLVDEESVDSLNHLDERLTAQRGLSMLNPPLRQVVELYYFQDQSQLAIAHALGISQMQVSRRLKKALDLMESGLSAPPSLWAPAIARRRTVNRLG